MMSLLPQDVQGWLTLVVQLSAVLVGVVGFSLRYIRNPLEREMASRFSNHGERLGKLEQHHAGHDAARESHERQLERLHLQLTASQEVQARHDARLERVLTKLEEYERERLDEDRTISVQLARLEEQMKAMQPLASVIIELSKRANA